MPILNFKKIQNDFLYSKYKKYDYKFGDLDLMSSGGLLGNSIMNFGLFYYEVVPEKLGNETRFKFKTQPVRQQIENIDQSNTDGQ